jgi:bifunctional UDP-N-acetylglucosamine pyrophosphorylase/glucosamine-1-phosphate N-acetyltransferase
MVEMKGIILCAGEGKKLWPFGEWRPKACLSVINQPIVERLVKQMEKIGIDEIVIVASYHADMIRHTLRKYGSVRVLEETRTTGTAKSVLTGLEGEADDILVAYGDIVVDDESMLEVLNTFNEKKQPITLIKKLKPTERSIDWICADCENQKVRGIYGHPRSHYVNSKLGGVFALPKSAISYLVTNPGYMMNVCVGGMPTKESELGQSIQMMIEDELSVLAIEVVNFGFDLDKPWHLLEANYGLIESLFKKMTGNEIAESAVIDDTAWIGGKIHLGERSRIGRNVIIKGDVYIGEDVVIDNGAIVEDMVIIGNGCWIEDTCCIRSYTTIGAHNKIGFNAEIAGVTFDHVSLAHNCEIRGVIGSYTDIAAGCLTGSLRFDDGVTPQRVQGRTEYPTNYSDAIFIGDHSRTGVGNIFLPGVKIGCNVALWPGAIIEKDIDSKTLVVVKQEKEMKSWGPDRYGW